MRRLLDRCLTAVAAIGALVAATLLVGVVVEILRRGAPALSWDFVTTATADAGAGGGVLYQILGTLLLVTTALAVALPPAVALALLETVYLRSPAARRRLRRGLYLWNGVPSIVLGIFGFVVFTRVLGWGKSWLAGGLVLGWMILPTLTVVLAERIAAVPPRYLEAARALGLSRSQTVRSVILPQSRSGLWSGALLGLARAAGETAPILFVAAVFSGATWPSGVAESPVLALPYHVFVLAQDSLEPSAQQNLWGSAAVLLAVVMGFSLAALPARLASPEEGRHG